MRTAKEIYHRFKTTGTILLIMMISGLFIRMNFSGEPMKRNGARNATVQDSLPSVYKYLGAEKCATKCHNNEKMGFQFDLWQKSSHASAYKDLNSVKAGTYVRKAHLNGNATELQACLNCHSTAAGLDTTYLSATYNKMDGVTCEACHKHFNNPKTYLPAESDCLVCHNNSLHPMPFFNFKDKIKKIEHNRPLKM